jgi:hypothetical protein
MKHSEIRSAHTRPPNQTVYNQVMKRRVNLAKDILEALSDGPQTLSAIVSRVEAKRNSTKSVIWALLRDKKIAIHGTGDAVCSFGPKKVNVYCLVSQPSE